MSQPLSDPSSRIDTSSPRPVVRATDIKVSQIASEAERLGMQVADILEAHPPLTRADVDAALAYYAKHPEVIRRDWQHAERLIATILAQYLGRSSQT
jgi:uncharacterized protein (DUF433 family)